MKYIALLLFVSCASTLPVFNVNRFQEGKKVKFESTCRNLNFKRCEMRSREYCIGLKKKFTLDSTDSVHETKSLANKNVHYITFRCDS